VATWDSIGVCVPIDYRTAQAINRESSRVLCRSRRDRADHTCGPDEIRTTEFLPAGETRRYYWIRLYGCHAAYEGNELVSFNAGQTAWHEHASALEDSQ